MKNQQLQNFGSENKCHVSLEDIATKSSSFQSKISLKLIVLGLLLVAGFENVFSQTQTFSSSGTFNVPTGVTKVTVEAWGGGGAGGGVNSGGGAGDVRAGGGGAGGTYTKTTNVTVTSGGTVTVTIGPGGAGASAASGGTGGTTTFASVAPVTAVGGGGGTLGNNTDETGGGAGTATGTTQNGGAGGTATGTNPTATGSGGGGGGAGNANAGGASTGQGIGAGGVAGGGPGAAGRTTDGNGNTGTAPGGGGSGGYDATRTTDRLGGDGGAGQVIVTWTQPTPAITVSGPTPTNGKPVFQVVFSTPINTGTFTSPDVTFAGSTATGTLAATITEIAPLNGTTFTLTISGMTASGTVIPSIAAGVLADVSGNLNIVSNAGTTINYVHDTTGPTVAITVSGPNPTNLSPVFQVVFNEPIAIASFTSGDVTLSGTAGATTPTIAQIAPNDGTTFTITVTGMTGAGTVIANIAAGTLTDVAATPNNNTVSNAGTTINFDNVQPTVTVNQAGAQVDPTTASPINFTAVFSKAINPATFVAGDVTNTGTAAGAIIGTPTTVDNITWNIPVTGMSGDGTVILSLAAAVVADPIGNTNVASTFTDKTVTFDVPPSVTINQAGAQPDPTNGATINFTAVFSKAVAPASFTAADVTISGTSLGGVAGVPTTSDNITWNIPVTGMTTSGTVIADIAAGVVLDPAGFGNTISTSTDKTVTYDITPPDVTVNQAGAQVDPTNASPVNFTVVFTEAINPATFTAGDITNSGTAPGAVIGTPTTANNITWNVPVTGTSGDGTIILSIAAAKVTDPVGNNNTASTSTDNSVTFDVPPTVTVNQAGAQPDPTNGATINFTAVFSKAIAPASFIASDVSLSGTAIGSVAGAPTTADNITWNIPVTGMSSSGTVIVALGAGVVLDAAGFGNVASTFTDKTVNFDNVAPDVTINQAGAQPDPTNASPINFTAVFSEAINPATFTAADITLSGTALGAVVGVPTTANNITWNIPVTGMSASGTVILSMGASNVTDPAGNGNTASTFTDQTVTFDNIPPSVTINQAGAQTDPTNTSPINFTAVFSEAINPATFIAGDLTNSGSAPGAVIGVPTTSDNITWNIPVTGMSGSGTVILSMAATKVKDPAGNDNTASTFTDQTVNYDITPPTVTVNQSGSQVDPTNGSPIKFTAVFSEAINPATFTAADITIGGTSLGSVAGVPTTVDNITWNIQISGMSTTGTVIASIGANKVTDLANNNNTASTFTDQQVTYDITPPAVTGIIIGPAAPLTGIGTTNGTTASSVPFQVTFSEPVSGLDPTDFVLSSTGTVVATIASVTGGPSVYNVTVNAITGNGTMRLDFFTNSTVIDVATNPTIASFNSGGAGATYTIALPQPAGHVTGFTATPGADNYSIILNWSTIVPSASGYLIRAKGQLDDDSNGTYVAVADGTPDFNDFVFGDGNGNVNVSTATTTFTFTTLLSGKTYNFEIIPWAWSGSTSLDNFDFLFDGSQPTATATTTTASTGLILAGSTIPPATISSLTTSYIAPVNLAFKLQDDGLSPGLDNARTRFTQLVFTAGAGNTVPVWSDVIAEAQLIDITENAASPVLTTTIGVNTITFSGLATGSNGIGALDDNETKEYNLRIRLKSTMTGGSQQNIDNQVFEFALNQANITNLVAASQLSKISVGQTISSGTPNRNVMDVSASQFTFNPAFGALQPPATAFVLTNLTATPVVRAIDANGNTDRNYSLPLTISNSAGMTMSTASLAASDSPSPNAGVYTFPAAFQYTNLVGGANNGTLTVSNGITGTSSNVTVSYSNTTKIVAGAFVEPLKFSTLLDQTVGMLVNVNRVFDFNVVDDNGAGGDGQATKISQIVFTQGAGNDVADWTQAIFDVLLYDGSTSIFGTVGATTITFSGLNFAPGGLGFVGDNVSKNYQLYIRYKSAMGGTLPSTVDNLNLVFEVLQSNILLDTQSSLITPGENQNSGATNNAVDVVSTKLSFTNIIGSPTLVSKDISIQQSVPVVEAQDKNNNRDLDYNSTTISVVDNDVPARTLLNAPLANSMNAGLLTFPNNFQFTTVSTLPSAPLSVATTTLNASGGTPTTAVSPAFTVRAGLASTITAGAAAPATLSSLVNASTGVAVFNFNVNDDPSGTPALQDDGNATFISSITITQSAANHASLVDWTQSIAGALLTDGTTTQVATAINPTTITFTGIPTGTLGNVADNGTKAYTLKIWLKSALGGSLPTTIDGKGFGFEVLTTNVLTTGAGTGILPAQIQNSGAANVVTVVATQLNFIFPAAPVAASLNSPFPGVTVQAIDANSNRDLDFTAGAGTVQTLTNTTGATMANAPVNGVTQFTTGLLTFSPLFKYTTGANNDIVTLTMTAGPGSISGTSAPITILSSFETRVAGDPTFSFSPNIGYVAYQATNIQPVDITNGNGSFELARILLSDGDADGVAGDVDGSTSVLTSLTIRIADALNASQMGAIRRIALYNSGFAGATEIAELTPTPGDIAAGQITFSGLNIVAPDDNLVAAAFTPTPISIRVSFNNTPGTIVDKTLLRVSIPAATLGVGSQFRNNVGDIAGVAGGLSAPAIVNFLNVVATKLDFTTQPAAFAGVNIPVTAGIVRARDQFDILDLDFNQPANASGATAPIAFSGAFSSGVLNLSSMLYSDVGNGTVTVSAGGISTVMNNTVGGLPNVSVSCNHVDVIHVSTSAATSGVITTSNLIGGTSGKVIYGVTFRSANNGTPYGVTTPVHAPLLNGFTISFSNPITGVLQNFKVFESSDDQSFQAINDTDVTTVGIGGVLSAGSQSLTVDFTGGTPRDLSDPNVPLTYFLMVDVNVNAIGATPPIQPDVADDGVFNSATNANISTSFGSHNSVGIAGQTYTFASIFPPTLTSSYPASGQLNVDPAQSKISLTFSVPVWTLDGVIKLYDQSNNNSVVVCPVHPTPVNNNGAYNNGAGGLLGTVDFDIPVALIPNHLYYVTIAAGNLGAKTGLMDQANNLFPGFTYAGTLYFKTATPAAPLLLGKNTAIVAPSDPNVKNVTLSGATINATFDQQGTAYYLILNSGSAAPTVSQIKAPLTYPTQPLIGASGKFDIVQTNPISQFGTITPTGGQFLTNQNYDVWMFAENNALPAPFAASFPYGAGPLFAEGAAGPTLTFTTPNASPPGITLNSPSVRICNNSYQAFNSPIVISEGNIGDFSTNVPLPGTAPTVVMNIGLPTGFQFDVSKTGGVPNHGKVQLVGADFIGTGSLNFQGNGILTISYKNNSSTSLDKIIIYDLKVLATSSSSGSLFRIGGTALTAAIPDGTPMGSLLSFDAAVIGFDNSYSKTALGNTPFNVVTSIPNNADDLDPNTAASTIELTPFNTNTSDFGPNSFSGQGVNINVLSLQAVTADVPFNITITHSDNNGCISQNAVQYTIYDHTTAINLSSGAPSSPPVANTSLAIIKSPFCLTNTNFVNSNLAINPVNRPTLGVDIQYIAFDNLPGYTLRSTPLLPAVVAKIPVNAPANQIIRRGTDWDNIVASLPTSFGTTLGIAGNGSPFTESFSIDVAKILDANFHSGGTLADPYNGPVASGLQSFRSSVTAQGNYYHTGGSLGLVEFTGTFQSTTNATVIIPRTQVVEFFVPAVPIVEVGQGNQPVAGTTVYCEAGGLITVNGYPAASAGSSVGRFTVMDAISSLVLYDIPPLPGIPTLNAAFVDNGNGTATLDPAVLKNSYKTIKIVYTYKDNNSPCQSTASITVQVTPNPVANFTFASGLTPNTPTGTEYCENRLINFDASSTTISTGFTVQSYGWLFGDANSPDPAPGASATGWNHTYKLAQTYTVSLDAISNKGCHSVPFTLPAPVNPIVGLKSQTIKVGGIPIVAHKFDGVSTSDVFNFSSNGSTVSSNDSFQSVSWDFGDGSPVAQVTYGPAPATDPKTNFTHNYATAGRKAVDLKVTSTIGCVNSLSLANTALGLSALDNGYARTIVVLPRATVGAGANAYAEDFQATNGNWQDWFASTPSKPLIFAPGIPPTPYSSWKYNTASGSVIKPDPNGLNGPPGSTTSVNSKFWRTYDGVKGYAGNERSALYSPSFDLTALGTPMISYNSIVQMESSDGLIVEYSTDDRNIADPLKVWNVLGAAIGEGVSWFTDKGIAAKPGNQSGNDFGWSGSSTTTWLTSKHTLDEISTTGPINKVVFRFALASAKATPSVEGFALDNVRVGDRTRTILLESFANTANASPSEATENGNVDLFPNSTVGTQVIKVNYHVSFPGNDPMNLDNPADPSARALYYNITTTPKSRLDGAVDPADGPFSAWSQTSYGTRSLQLAQAVITPTATLVNGIVRTQVDVKAVFDLPANTILQVAIVEKSLPLASLSATQKAMVKSGETNFVHVLKKMLPTAAGTRFGSILIQGNSKTFGPFDWIPEPTKLYLPANDLRVVTFLQNELTGEVYQVNYADVNDPTPITGLEPLSPDDVLVYPNPANHEMNIRLPGVLQQAASVQMVDQVGHITVTTTIPEGANSKTINTRDLAAGMYILMIETGPGISTRKKVMVVHEE